MQDLICEKNLWKDPLRLLRGKVKLVLLISCCFFVADVISTQSLPFRQLCVAKFLWEIKHKYFLSFRFFLKANFYFNAYDEAIKELKNLSVNVSIEQILLNQFS